MSGQGSFWGICRSFLDLPNEVINITYWKHLGSVSFHYVTEEIKHGLASTFLLKCFLCGYVSSVITSQERWSGERGPRAFDINTRVALRGLHAGIGQSSIINSLLTIIIPTMNLTILKTKKGSYQNSIERVGKKAGKNGAEGEEDNLIPVSC